MSGLEVVGVVASALQLGAYTYRAVQVLSSLRSDLRSAPRWLQERANYLESLIQTLNCIEVQHYSNNPNLYNLTKDIYHKTTALQKILAKGLHHIETRSFTRSLRILQFNIAERREVKTALAELEQDKSSLHLCITILQSRQLVQNTSTMKSQKLAKARGRLATVLAPSTGEKKSKETSKLEQVKLDKHTLPRPIADYTGVAGPDLGSEASVVDHTSVADALDQEHTTSSNPVPCAAHFGKGSKDKSPTEPFESGNESGQTSLPRESAPVDDFGSAPLEFTKHTNTGQHSRYSDERPAFYFEDFTFENTLHLGSKTVNGASPATTTPETYKFKTVRCFGHSQIGSLALDGDAYRAEKEIEARVSQARNSHGT